MQQIGQVASALFAGTPYKTVTLIGGANVQNQLKHLREDRPQIVVATPGRLAEIVFELEKLRLSGVHTVVIDEVDQMLREPYIGEVETLLQATPFVLRKQDVTTPLGGQLGEEAALEEQENSSEELVAQADDSSSSSGSIIMDSSIGGRPSNRHLLCLVSATSHDPAVTAFADRYCTHSDSGITTSRNSEITTTSTSSDSNESVEAIKPLRKKCLKIAASGGAMLPRSITHGLISTPRMRSLEFLKRFLNARPSVQHALIFVNDPRRVEGVVKELGMAGIVAAPLHGETSKDDRKVPFV